MTLPLDRHALISAANGGDSGAQYALAASLHRDGQTAEAMQWLERAAHSGHSHAQYTWAARELSGATPLKQAQVSIDLLRKSASAGVHQAKRLLSVVEAWGLKGAANWELACQLLMDACEAGDPGALREAGLLWLLNNPGDEAAVRLVHAAALKGDSIAQAFAGRFGFGDPNEPGTPPPRHQVEPHLRVPVDVPLKAPRPMLSAPKVETIPGLLMAWECDYIIARAEPMLAPSQMIDEGTGKPKLATDRTSSTAVFWPTASDLVITHLDARMALAAGLPMRNGEMLNVLRYQPGQEYKPHFDVVDPAKAGSAQFLAEGGQRVRTLLVALNDDYTGGETSFIRAKAQWRGAKGDALIFDNVTPDGAPDPMSLHAGLPVAQGVKWLASKWYRSAEHW